MSIYSQCCNQTVHLALSKNLDWLLGDRGPPDISGPVSTTCDPVPQDNVIQIADAVSAGDLDIHGALDRPWIRGGLN